MRTMLLLFLCSLVAACGTVAPPPAPPPCPELAVAGRALSDLTAPENPNGHRFAFGWQGDDGNKRVMMMAPRSWPIQTIAPSSNLQSKCPTAKDQGPIGSCVGHGVAEAVSMAYFAATGQHLDLSRLMIYYNARAKEGNEAYDAGCQIVDAVSEMGSLGSCLETMWPYITANYRFKPCPDAYKQAGDHRALQSLKVDNTDGRSIRLSLTNGSPVIMGALVYSAIQDLDVRNNVLPMPRSGERPIGGHCMLIVGHDDATQRYLVLNSWGLGWGVLGFCWIPYEYIHSPRITEDCWVIREVSLPPTPAPARKRFSVATIFTP